MAEPKLRFRNYVPRDATLAASVDVVPLATLPTLPEAPPAPAPTEEEAPVLLVPKKANWDLKRDLAPKLERLESMTQRAIAELVREKIAAGANSGSASGQGVSGKAGGVAGAAGGAGMGSGSGSGSGSGGGAAKVGGGLDEVYVGPVDVAILSRGFQEGELEE